MITPLSADDTFMVWRFLSLAGKNPRLPEIAGVLDDAPAMEHIADRFTAAGIPSRAVRVDAVDLRYVPVPALFRTRSGGHAVLRSTTRATATVELSPGTPSILPLHQVLTLLDRTAVVMGHSVRPQTEGPVEHWLAIVRASPQATGAIRRLVALSLLLFALGVSGPLVTRVLVDTALPNIERSTLLLVVVITVVVAFHRATAMWLRERAMLYVDANAEGELLRLVFDRLLRAPLTSGPTKGAGELQQVLASAQAFASDLTKGLLVPLFDTFLATGYLVALAWLSPTFALAALASTFVYLGLAVVRSRHIRTLQGLEIDALARERATLHSLIGGLPTLRAAGAEDFALSPWRKSLANYQRTSVQRADAESLTHHALELVERVTGGAFLIAGAWMCLQNRASTGELLGAMGALGAYGSALRGFADAVLRWSTLAGHADRLQPILTAPRTSVDLAHTRKRPQVLHSPAREDSEDAIVVDRVWFRHGKSSPWLMQDFSLRARRGTLTSIRWPSGAGKTTLLRLLAGLLSPERGTISIERMDPAHARDRVLYLPQDAHLFGGSVLENLRLLSGGATKERILHAAETTGLRATLSAWPMGFDTLIASRGANVSSGQRQLILLTAAIASDRPILLLDESLANVDRVQRAMLENAHLFSGRTVISVVHDDVRRPVTERAD